MPINTAITVNGPTLDRVPMLRTEAVSGGAPTSHLHHLDGLRAILAIYVVMHHCWLGIWPTPYGVFPTGIASILTGWLAFGRVAVDWFIVLSGYCLMLPVAKHDGELRGGAIVFFVRRARRILPTFYAALAFSLLMDLGPDGRMTGSLWDWSLPVSMKAVLANVLMFQDVVRPYKINGVFWSICSRVAHLLFVSVARLGL